jgi:serine protease AprX
MSKLQMCISQKIVIILVTAMLLLSMVGTVFVPIGAQAASAQPQLLELARKTPEQLVRVIAQKADSSDRAEKLVAHLGGQVTQDLHIINAFAAQLSADSAVKLAQSAAVRWVSLDGAVESTAKPIQDPPLELKPNTYLETLNVQPVWDMGYDGSGVGVAVIDSGVATDRDFSTEPGKPKTRIGEEISFSTNSFKIDDATGHGTHVAGIIGGNGTASDGLYVGVAPKVGLHNLKVSDDFGQAYESDVVAAMQWVYDNKDKYNIQVVNLSVNSTVETSYHNSPMSAAAEILWFNGVVVVVSAGNYDGDTGFKTIQAAPANDPFLITVGASNENATADRSDDEKASFSSKGTTIDGYTKPEIYAPGKDIISVLANTSTWDQEYPDRDVLDGEYFRLSGTSMSAPMVTGAAALLLQAEPDLTPDQVKYRLLNSCTPVGDEIDCYLDVYAAITTPTAESANTGMTASQLLWSGEESVTWESVAWNSVAWNSVAWNSVAWNSVAWNSVAWNSVAWND